MASFQKRGKTWQYTVSRYIDGVYKPIRKGGFRTKEEARIAANEVENKLNKGLLPSLSPISLSDYFFDWIKVYKPHINKNTRERYLEVHKVIEIYFGNKPLRDIKKKNYQEFINDYGKTRSRETVKRLNTDVRACVQEAIEENIIAKDFTKNVIIFGLEPKKSEEKHLNYAETKKLIKFLYKKIDDMFYNKKIYIGYFVILLGINTGMRYGEIIGLTKNDIDFENNTITINKIWGYKKQMKWGFGKTKNDSSNRVIKIGKKTAKVFEKLYTFLEDNEYNLIFYRPDSQYKVYANGPANELLKKTLKKLGLKEITMHGLRHTHASILLYKNVSINYVSQRLGHKDIDTTLKHYIHILKELQIKEERKTIKIFD